MAKTDADECGNFGLADLTTAAEAPRQSVAVLP
jgi:hypothetical protein